MSRVKRIKEPHENLFLSKSSDIKIREAYKNLTMTVELTGMRINEVPESGLECQTILEISKCYK